MIAFAPFRRTALAALAASGLAAGIALTASSSAARTDVDPYIEIQQVLTADLNDGGDVLTYTAAAAGVNARTSNRRVEAQISYRYERRISYNEDLFDEDVHSGLAQARVQVVPGKVTFDAGAMAARSRGDGAGPVFGFTSVDNKAVSEVYGIYGGPTLSTRLGDFDVGASYQAGYVQVDDHSRAGLPPVPGQRIDDRYDSSVSHNVSASVGMAPGRLPVGWTVGAGYVREDVNRLDHVFEGKYVRGDVVVPVGANVALTGGVGYEKISSEQDAILADSAGVPILTPGGQLIADPSRPRVLAYETDGLIWDAGVIWRPSRRTELQARVGRRYDGTTVTGSFRHDFNSAFGVRASVYDSVTSFGRVLIGDIKELPMDFNVNRNPLNAGVGGIGGCVFGRDPGSGTCFDDAFQSISNNDFRMRGANVVFSGNRGPWSMGVGGGYSRRKYFAPETYLSDLDGVVDQSFTLSAYASRELSRTSSVSFDAYASWYDSDRPLMDGAFSTGLSGSYYRTLFGDRVQGFAAAGVSTTDAGAFDSTNFSGLVGLRYSF